MGCLCSCVREAFTPKPDVRINVIEPTSVCGADHPTIASPGIPPQVENQWSLQVPKLGR